MESTTRFGGELAARHNKNRTMVLRIPGLGRVMFTRDQGDALITGRQALATRLVGVHRDGDGKFRDKRDHGSGLVTHAGVLLLSQDINISAGVPTLAAMKYQATGTGTTSATSTDTTLQAAVGTVAYLSALSQSDSSPNALIKSVATLSYTASLAISEWGLFNSGTLAGATMWDHKVFAGYNVISGDTIQFTYTLTLTSGG